MALAALKIKLKLSLWAARPWVSLFPYSSPNPHHTIYPLLHNSLAAQFSFNTSNTLGSFLPLGFYASCLFYL